MLLNAIFMRRLTAAHTSRAHDKDCESAVHRLRALYTAAPVVQRIAPVAVQSTAASASHSGTSHGDVTQGDAYFGGAPR